MLSFLVHHPNRIPRSHLNPIEYEGGRSSVQFFPPTDDFFMQVTLPPTVPASSSSRRDNSIILPPLHWHKQQNETFNVVSGKMLATLEGRQLFLDAGHSVHIPKRAVHKFENASSDESLVTRVKLDPYNPKRDERFFRNVYGYLEDCNLVAGPEVAAKGGIGADGTSKTMPNIFQLLLWLHEADIVTAVPVLPRFIGHPVGVFLGWFGGVVVGKWLLGLKDTYPEYSEA